MSHAHQQFAVLAEIARNQAGVFSRAQARACGVSASAQQRRIDQGIWQASGRALIWHRYARGGDEYQAWHLQILAGSDAIVTGPVAARLGGWFITGEERIVIMRDHDRCDAPGVKVMRRANPAWPVRPTGLRIAHPLDALADTAICRPLRQAESLIDHALQKRWITPESFDVLIGHRAGKGRRGVGRLRVLRERVISGSHSTAEQHLVPILRRSRTGMWLPNYVVRDESGSIVAELDFALPDLRIAIEVDGRAFHSDRASFDYDRVRQNWLVANGWSVLRFTWDIIMGNPQEVVSVLRAAVNERRVHLRATS
jgi:very-short-patch-repair endonuclease